MTVSDHSQVEAAVLRAVRQALEHHSAPLKKAGLTFRSPEVEVGMGEPSRYTSELRVYFYRDDDLVDAIEFHIFENGRQVVDEKKLPDWLAEDIAGAIERAVRR